MSRPASKMSTTRRCWIAAALALAVVPAWGCGPDVGDSSAIPGPGGDASVDVDASLPAYEGGFPPGQPDGQGGSPNDSTPQTDSAPSSGDASGQDAGVDATGGQDTGAPDTGLGVADAGAPDTGVPDEGPPDTGAQDGGAADSTIQDTGSPDTGVADTGVDATLADTGVDAEDTGTVDTGVDTGPDSTLGDSGGPDAQDTGAAETGGPDGQADAAQGDGGLVPCTVAGQTGCVECVGNNSKECTPTEALIVQHDIDKGTAHAPGADPAGSCYDCLYQNGCIDDSQGDVEHECHDSSVTHGTEAQCLDVVSCIFGSDDLATDSLATGTVEQGYSAGNCSSLATYVCYCGTASLTGNCGGSSSAANGNCSDVIAAGSGFPVSDGTDNLGHFAPDTTYASGMGTQIFKCAVNNACAVCLQ